MDRHGSASGSLTTYAACATFGELLKVLRRRARLTQRELATAVGYSETYITRLEVNSRLPDPTAVEALFVTALGVQDEPELARRLITLARAAHDQATQTVVRPIPLHNLPA